MEQGAVQRYGVLFQITGDGLRDNFLKPLPGETVAALTRHDSHPCSGPGCAPAITNYHSTFGDVDDRPLHHFGQPGVDWSKTPVRLCETRETRETRDRAQSTAHH